MRLCRDSAFALLVAGAAILLFLPALRNGFTNWDDSGYITNNPAIVFASLGSLGDIFLRFRMDSYQPLALLSFWAESAVWGVRPLPFHLTNILLHALNCVLVFRVLRALSGQGRAALVAALLFAIFPLQVESVAWISERKGLLAASFCLLSLDAYAAFLRRPVRRLYAAALVCFLFALLSKGVAASFVMVYMLTDRYRGVRSTTARWLQKLPFLVLAGVFVTIGLCAHFSPNRAPPSGMMDWAVWAERLGMAGYALVFYLHKIVAPFGLSCLYPYPAVRELLFPSILSGVLIAGIFVLRKRVPALIWGTGFFFSCLLPTLQLVPLGKAPVADRYVYLASCGIFFAIGMAYERYTDRRVHRMVRLAATGALVILLVFYALQTALRIPVWKDSVSLWSDALRVRPSALAYNNRGIAYAERGDFPAAIKDYERALSADPFFLEAVVNRGNAFYRLGDLARAQADYEAAVRLNPRVANPHLYLAFVALSQGRFADARRSAEEALKIYPQASEAWYVLGQVHRAAGALQEAVAAYTKAITYAPATLEYYLDRASVYVLSGDQGKALQDIRVLEAAGYRLDDSVRAVLRK